MTKNIEHNNTTRWGIIGCGDVTEVKSGPAYQLTEGFELIAVMRRDREKARDYAERHTIKKYFSDADELINDNEVDAIYIATPPDSHKYYALKVAAAGKPCCIEKPMAPTYQESQAIYDAFKAKNIPLYVAYYRRSLPRFEKVKEWIGDNEIGDIRHIEWHLTKAPNQLDLSNTYNWRTDANVAIGGYFDDLASHGLNLFTYLLGDITEVTGFTNNQQNIYSAKDAITACWRHTNGITGTGSWHFGCRKNEDKVTLFGSKGEIEFSVFDETSIIVTTDTGKQKLFIDHPKHVQEYHVKNILNDLKGISQHPSTGLSAVHTSWVMDKILGTI